MSISTTMINFQQDERKMAKFAQYATAASFEALEDADWFPKSEYDKEMTVIQMTFSSRAIAETLI